MICGNTQAEIERDTETNSSDLLALLAEIGLWEATRKELLSGKVIEGQALEAYLYDKYQEFADLVDEDIEFMALYAEGGLTPKARKIIEQEAETLASIIVG